MKKPELHVPWAYAVVEDPERPGRFFSVELRNVVCEKLTHLEKSERSEYLGNAAARVTNAVHLRGAKRQWNT